MSACFQERFLVKAWASIFNDYLIDPYLLPHRLNSMTNRMFLEEVLPESLNGVPVAVGNAMLFQHDGAPVHFIKAVINYLNATYGPRWIG